MYSVHVLRKKKTGQVFHWKVISERVCIRQESMEKTFAILFNSKYHAILLFIDPLYLSSMYILYPFRSYISIANTMLSDSIIYVFKFIKQYLTFSRFYLKYLSKTCIVYFLQNYGFVHRRTICQCLVSFVLYSKKFLKTKYALIFPKM